MIDPTDAAALEDARKANTGPFGPRACTYCPVETLSDKDVCAEHFALGVSAPGRRILGQLPIRAGDDPDDRLAIAAALEDARKANTGPFGPRISTGGAPIRATGGVGGNGGSVAIFANQISGSPRVEANGGLANGVTMLPEPVGRVSMQLLADGTGSLGAVSGKVIGFYVAHEVMGRDVRTPVQRLYAIVGTSEDDTIASLKEELHRVRGVTTKHYHRVTELERSVEAMTKELGATKTDLDKMEESRDAYAEGKRAVLEKARRIEEDLAKVRMYFGDKAFNEALGAKK